ncbi:MAG: hypothetical protein AAFU65_17510 [Pseudomonadota bacterium]
MKTIRLGLTALFFGLLTGCAGVAVNECAFEQVTFCAGQAVLEGQINGLLDRTGAASCVDVVHTCPEKAQCPFAGCGTEAERGDWERVVVTDPRK